jgi:Cu-Zn family superoxide dismutase
MPFRCSAFALAVPAAMVAVLATGCSSTQGGGDADVGVASQFLGRADAIAAARMQPVAGSPVEGKVSFSQFGSVTVVRARFFGLQGSREYGLHVHEKGDCSGDDGAAAGGHFDPGGAPHGRPGRGAHHAGDLLNLRTDGEGNALYVFETSALSVAGGRTSVLNRSVILTRGPDDYRTQPDGNSGPPLACGIVHPN